MGFPCAYGLVITPFVQSLRPTAQVSSESLQIPSSRGFCYQFQASRCCPPHAYLGINPRERSGASCHRATHRVLMKLYNTGVQNNHNPVSARIMSRRNDLSNEEKSFYLEVKQIYRRNELLREGHRKITHRHNTEGIHGV